MRRLMLLTMHMFLAAGYAWAACEQYPAGSGHWYPGTFAEQSLVRDDVQSCIADASAGHVIHLKAGTADWSGGGVTINRQGVIILGAGNTGCPTACDDRTTINVGSATAFTGARSNYRISGITFSGNGASGGIIIANCNGCAATQNWRIDHNHFKNTTGRAITVGSGATRRGYSRDYPGVIDSNFFDAPARFKAVEINGHSETAHGTWDDPLDLGGPSWVFFEDNVLAHTRMPDGVSSINTIFGGRMVVRFNTFTNGDIATHGAESCGPGGHPYCPWFSTHGFEIYRNTMAFSTTHNFTINLRGGQGPIFDNIATGTPGTFHAVRYFYERGDGLNRCIGDTKCQGAAVGWDENRPGQYGYMCYQQPGTTGANGITPSPIYQWGNIFFSSANEAAHSTVTYSATCNYQHVQFGRDVILMTSGSVGTALPGTCTVGDRYWKTNDGTWNNKPGGRQGRMYACTDGSTWEVRYTPYTYPHPLRAK